MLPALTRQHPAAPARASSTSTAATRAGSTSTGSRAPSSSAPTRRPSISQMDLAAVLADPARSRALSAGTSIRWRRAPSRPRCGRALERDDLLTVVCDLFLTDTAAYADYVLPGRELPRVRRHPAVVLPPHALGPGQGASSRPGDALRNAEIFRRLAAGMGFDEAELQDGRRRADRASARALGRQLGRARARGHGAPLPEPRVQFADGFPTPSGKIELASASAEADGHPRLPEPSVDAPRRPPASCGCSRPPRPGS